MKCHLDTVPVTPLGFLLRAYEAVWKGWKMERMDLNIIFVCREGMPR